MEDPHDVPSEEYGFGLLPDEVLEKIVVHLPYYALVRLSGSSRRMLRVCTAARELTVPFPTEAKLQVLVKRFPKLTVLSFEGESMARVGLKDIMRFKALEHLCLRDCTEVDENLLRFIARLPALKRLDLSHCASVDDRLLLSLVSLGKLEYLNLAGCHISDGGLWVFAERGADVHKIDVSECRSVSDYSLEFLSASPSLWCLRMRNTDVTDQGFLRSVPRLNNLRELSVSTDKLTHEGLRALLHLTGLERLDLSNCVALGDTGMEVLARLPLLSRLSLDYCNVSDQGICQLASLEKLTSLSLCGTRVSDTALEALSQMPCLAYLDISACDDVTDAGISILACGRNPLTQLVAKDLGGVTGQTLHQLSKLKGLRRLDLSGTHLLDAGLRALMKVTSLEALSLSRCPLTNDVVAAWAQQHPPRLHTLDIAECPLLSDGAMEHLAKMSSLRNIRLRFLNITDDGVELLCQKQSMTTSLSLISSNITSEAVTALSESQTFRWLKGLNISGCFKVKDISPLLRMTQLNTVILHDRMSESNDGLVELRRLLPDCHVSRGGGVFVCQSGSY